jgi:peptidoglycan/LPS O-acetylase OafA/YrhL
VVLLAACNITGDISGLPRLVIQVTMTLFLAACVLDEGHALARLLSRPAIRRIGAISYGMYLYHHIARHGAEALLKAAGLASPLALFFVCSLLTIALSELSFRWIEAPMSKLKGRFSAQSPRSKPES